MTFDKPEIQRLYEAITDKYHQVYNRYLAAYDDEEAYYKALHDGYEMVTDDQLIDGKSEFATSYSTPEYVLDVWYEFDPYSGKRLYNKGFIRITSKPVTADA